MSRPPMFPVNAGQEDYFMMLARKAKPYLDKEGIVLNFAGYTDLMKKYYQVDIKNMKLVEELSVSFNGWSEYFSSLANLIQSVYLDAETDKISIQSKESITYNEKNVSAGERYANTTDNVIAIRKKRNTLKSLYEELSAKARFSERAHYHCKSIYEWNCKLNQSYKRQV